MTNKEANERFEELTYDLAKCVSQLNEIKSKMEFVNTQMGWDGMFLCDFDDAIGKLASVESGAIVYTLEEKYRSRDIDNMKREIKALEDIR